MRNTIKAWGVGLCLALCLALPVGRAADMPPQISDAAALLASDPVNGVAMGEWTADWWRWALSQPIPPYLDPDGRVCDVDQHGPVWFLAGTNGRFRPQRECTVPEGKYLLVPIINMISVAGSRKAPCKELRKKVAVNNDNLVSAVVLLDGQPLSDIRAHRVATEACFHMDPDDGSSRLAAADGYWIMLKPLPRGRHTLTVGANYGTKKTSSYGNMQQNFEYVLHVGGRSMLSRLDRPDAAQVASISRVPTRPSWLLAQENTPTPPSG